VKSNFKLIFPQTAFSPLQSITPEIINRASLPQFVLLEGGEQDATQGHQDHARGQHSKGRLIEGGGFRGLGAGAALDFSAVEDFTETGG
jgi:hypothetical protein